MAHHLALKQIRFSSKKGFLLHFIFEFLALFYCNFVLKSAWEIFKDLIQLSLTLIQSPQFDLEYSSNHPQKNSHCNKLEDSKILHHKKRENLLKRRRRLDHSNYLNLMFICQSTLFLLFAKFLVLIKLFL